MSFMNLLSLIYILIPARSKHGVQATSMMCARSKIVLQMFALAKEGAPSNA
jgi:hypothetical protein